MQYRILSAFCIVILLFFCLAGCSPGSNEASLKVTCNEFREQPSITRTLEVIEGGTIEIILCTSATTGFLWTESAEISGEAVLLQTDHIVLSKSVTDASTRELWTFQAVESGNSTIILEYERPWEIEES